MINIKSIKMEKNEVVIINNMITLSLVPGNSALPLLQGDAIKISGIISKSPDGFSAGNSGYNQRTYRNDILYVQPGIVIPHETQLPSCYLAAAGAMYWKTSYPISHENKVYEEEENTKYWKHGEIIFNKECGEITFAGVNETVEKLWEDISKPLLEKQLKEIEIGTKRVYEEIKEI